MRIYFLILFTPVAVPLVLTALKKFYRNERTVALIEGLVIIFLTASGIAELIVGLVFSSVFFIFSFLSILRFPKKKIEKVVGRYTSIQYVKMEGGEVKQKIMFHPSKWRSDFNVKYIGGITTFFLLIAALLVLSVLSTSFMSALLTTTCFSALTVYLMLSYPEKKREEAGRV